MRCSGGLCDQLAQLCKAAQKTLGVATRANVYITNSGLRESIPPHSDKQDILIFQSTGMKRWQVFEPLAPPKGVHPLHRGKSEDKVQAAELRTPLLDVVLKPGQVIHVPIGYIHVTSTDTGQNDASDQTSVHVTLNFS